MHLNQGAPFQCKADESKTESKKQKVCSVPNRESSNPGAAPFKRSKTVEKKPASAAKDPTSTCLLCLAFFRIPALTPLPCFVQWLHI